MMDDERSPTLKLSPISSGDGSVALEVGANGYCLAITLRKAINCNGEGHSGWRRSNPPTRLPISSPSGMRPSSTGLAAAAGRDPSS